MKNLIVACLLCFASNGIYAQISGNTSPQSVTPATATVIDATITVGGTVNQTNATVQISNNYYAGDVLAFDATLATSFGITGSYSTSSGVSGILTFTGTTTPANWQALLRTVTYQNTAASCGPSSRTIVFNQGSYLFNSYSQHFYQYVNTPLNWVQAKAAAAASSYNGMQGYLATITSAGENNFVWKLLAADAWIGGSYDYSQINAATGTTTYADQASAIGQAYWITGPEAGTKFSSGLSSPTAYNGAYMNWNNGEPNDAGNEYYVEFYSTGAQGGKWNDLGIGNTLPYVVEYGGLPNDVPQNNNLTETLTIASTTGGDITGGDVSVCSGTNSTTLTSTAAVPGVTIVRWESSIDNFLTTATPIANTSATYIATNLTQTTYFRSIATGNSCSTSPSSVTKITVGNSVAGTIAADNTTVCNGSAANLSLAGNVGDVLKWQSSTDNTNWTDISNTTALYTTPALSTGTYYYRAQVQSTGCTLIATSNPITITATVGSTSVGGTLADASVCPSPNSTTLTLTDYTGVIQKWQSSTNGGVTWSDIANTGATNTATNLAVTTSYRVNVKNGSCNAVNSSTGTVTVYPLPVVAAITGTATVCAGSTTTLSDITTGGVWTSGSTSVATVDGSGVVTGVAAGTSVITYTVTNGGGCSTAVSQTVTVNAQPTVAAITGTATLCAEGTTTLSNVSPGGVWTSDNTSVATVDASGIVTGISSGTSVITYTVTNGGGCSAAATQTVTVNALPSVAAITGTATLCSGTTTTLADATAGGVWSSGTTSVATVDASGVVTPVSAGSSVITYTVTNGSGCSNAVTQTVTVNALPTVAAITGTATVCAGSTTTLTDATAGGVWSSSNSNAATVDASGLVTGVADGNADITYTVTNGNGCSSAVTQTVTVNALPVVSPVTGTATVCSGLTTALSDATAGGVWFSSNTLAATVDENGLVTGVAAGTANITYTITNGSGCTNVSTLAVTVNDPPVLDAITGNATLCAGTTSTLSNTTQGGVWSSATSSVASIDASGVVTGVSEGTSVITYTVTNGSGCSNSVIQTVTVNAQPVVAAITSNGTDISLGYTRALSDATAGGVWSSSDAGMVSVDDNGVATGSGLGTATISYTVSNGSGCSASATITLNTVEFANIEAPQTVDSLYYIGDPQNPSTPIDQISALPGTSLSFYSSASGGSGSSIVPSLPSQPGTVTYWVSQTLNGVESPRAAFKVTMVTPDVFVPKVFTPNNDGINDIIKPIIPGLKNFRFFKIYNRWGNLVYMSTDPNAGWDGTYKGTPQPRESYLWMIEGENMNGQTKRYSGMITLFR
ncbi:MAG: Ig-like domain-containing protein [Bacteroidota bacterium]|nr:Ig-like domain-containing protein [Bacteroidota bacterium]